MPTRASAFSSTALRPSSRVPAARPVALAGHVEVEHAVDLGEGRGQVVGEPGRALQAHLLAAEEDEDDRALGLAGERGEGPGDLHDRGQPLALSSAPGKSRPMCGPVVVEVAADDEALAAKPRVGALDEAATL